MSKHVTELLNAYLDGELHGARVQYVEDHLAGCEICQAELESLEKLSDLLQEVPAPEFTPAEQFATRVNLSLPSPTTVSSRRKALEIGWWMIPVGLLATWVLLQVSSVVGNILSTANSLGLLTSVSNWMVLGTATSADWSSILGQIGILRGNSFELAASAETFTRTSLPQMVWQSSIALLYLSWIAIWWARQARQRHGQPLTG